MLDLKTKQKKTGVHCSRSFNLITVSLGFLPCRRRAASRPWTCWVWVRPPPHSAQKILKRHFDADELIFSTRLKHLLHASIRRQQGGAAVTPQPQLELCNVMRGRPAVGTRQYQLIKFQALRAAGKMRLPPNYKVI